MIVVCHCGNKIDFGELNNEEWVTRAEEHGRVEMPYKCEKCKAFVKVIWKWLGDKYLVQKIVIKPKIC